MNDVRRLLVIKANLETVMQRDLETSVRVYAEQQLDAVCKQIEEARIEWNKLFEQQEIDQLKHRVSELEASNAALLGALEDFVISVECYFGYSELDDIQPKNDMAYFIGEYRTAKNLIKKARGYSNE
jgi:hypothetical protein